MVCKTARLCSACPGMRSTNSPQLSSRICRKKSAPGGRISLKSSFTFSFICPSSFTINRGLLCPKRDTKTVFSSASMAITRGSAKTDSANRSLRKGQIPHGKGRINYQNHPHLPTQLWWGEVGRIIDRCISII